MKSMKLSELAEKLMQEATINLENGDTRKIKGLYEDKHFRAGVIISSGYDPTSWNNMEENNTSYWLYIDSKTLKISFEIENLDPMFFISKAKGEDRIAEYPKIEDIKLTLKIHREELIRIGFIDDLEDYEREIQILKEWNERLKECIEEEQMKND